MDKVRLGLAVSALFVLAASVLLAAPLFIPVLELSGYIEGHVAILRYNLTYAHDEEPQRLHNIEWISTAALGYAATLAFTALISLLSLALLARGNVRRSAEALYGASLALALAYAFLARVLFGALEADMAALNGLVREKIVIRNLAGEIEVVGISIEHNAVVRLALSIALALIIQSALLSAASLLSLNGSLELRPPRLALLRYGAVPALTLLILLQGYGSAFVYYPERLELRPQAPPAHLEALQAQPLCTITRVSRAAPMHTDFETYPVSGWAAYGGVWQLSSGGGYRGNALRGYDNNGGVGRESSQYYWNSRIDGYTSLWVSVRVRAEGGSDAWKGIGLMNADRTRLYEISAYGGSLNLYRYAGGWSLVGRQPINGYAATNWYTIVANYIDRGTSIEFRIWAYDVNGNEVAYLSVTDTAATRFRPAYAGVTIDGSANVWMRFDDFIVSTADPRAVTVENVSPGFRVQIIDNLNSVVGEATASGTTVSVSVTRDIVVGTGTNGRIRILDQQNQVVCDHSVPTSDAILGGDVYRRQAVSVSASFGANRTSAIITASMTPNQWARFNITLSAQQALYAKLVVISVSAPELTMSARVVGTATSTSIQITSGSVVVGETSVVPLAIGAGNRIEFAATLSAVPPAQRSVELALELCTAQGAGACVRYPISLRFS